MRIVIGKDTLQYIGAEGTHVYHPIGTPKQWFLIVFKDSSHQGEYRTTDNKIEAAITLIQVPFALYLTEHRRVYSHKLLKLIDDEGKRACLR